MGGPKSNVDSIPSLLLTTLQHWLFLVVVCDTSKTPGIHTETNLIISDYFRLYWMDRRDPFPIHTSRKINRACIQVAPSLLRRHPLRSERILPVGTDVQQPFGAGGHVPQLQPQHRHGPCAAQVNLFRQLAS